MADENTRESPEDSHRTNPESEPAAPEDIAQTNRSLKGKEPVHHEPILDESDVPHSPHGPGENRSSDSESNFPAGGNAEVDIEESHGQRASPMKSNSPESPPALESSPPLESPPLLGSPPEHEPFLPLQPSNIAPDQIYCPFQPSNIVPHQTEEAQANGVTPDSYSDYSDDTASTTDTITSTNYKFHYENERRYHGFGSGVPYLLPNDEREQERLLAQHKMWLMALDGKLHLAPLPENIHEVLDVGTGTGAWALNFADLHPNAQVIGTDLSPIQPNLMPPNCNFIIDNSEDDWDWREKFDFIHSRNLASSWRDWPGYFRKCYEALKPGAYLEIQDYTLPFQTDIPNPTVEPPSHKPSSPTPPNPVLAWSQHFVSACAQADVPIHLTASLDLLLQAAGFTSITKRMIRQPFSGWSSDPLERAMGEMNARTFDWGISLTMFMRRLGWSRVEAEVFLVDVRKAAKDEGNRIWAPLYVYTARKPE